MSLKQLESIKINGEHKPHTHTGRRDKSIPTHSFHKRVHLHPHYIDCIGLELYAKDISLTASKSDVFVSVLHICEALDRDAVHKLILTHW